MKPFVLNLRRQALAAAAFVMPLVHASDVAVDASIADYKTVSGVSGNLNSIGSDTLNNVMTFWAEGFKALYPNVNVQIEGKGSATAPPALIEGTAQLGPMSRAMKSEEIDAFERRFGYKPTEIKVAIDALAVFVHKDNPVQGLNMKQLDGIFSSTRKSGAPEITTWDQAGLAAWAGRAISIYGRNSASGTYGYFKDHALDKGDYKNAVKEQPGSSAVVQGVSADQYGIGYSGIGYATSGVRALPLSSDGGAFVEPTYANCLSGDYPMARFLFVYINKKPGAPLETLTREFLKFVLSKSGQSIVIKDGYFPVPAEAVEEGLGRLK